MDGKFGAVHRAVAILDKFHQHLPPRAKDQFEAVPQRSGNFTSILHTNIKLWYCNTFRKLINKG